MNTIYETYPQYRKSNGWIYYRAFNGNDYIDGYETSNGYGVQATISHINPPRYRKKQNGTWGDWTSYILNSDLVFGYTDSFSISGNTSIRKTIDLPGLGSNYRLFCNARGSSWAVITAVYCNTNQAVLDVRNFNASQVEISIEYTTIRK